MKANRIQALVMVCAFVLVGAGMSSAHARVQVSGRPIPGIAAGTGASAQTHWDEEIDSGSKPESYAGRGEAIHDPPSTGSLTAQQQGTLTITYNAVQDGYEAVWVWSGLRPG